MLDSNTRDLTTVVLNQQFIVPQGPISRRFTSTNSFGSHAGYCIGRHSMPRWVFTVIATEVKSWAIQTIVKNDNTGAAFPPRPKGLGFHAEKKMNS